MIEITTPEGKYVYRDTVGRAILEEAGKVRVTICKHGCPSRIFGRPATCPKCEEEGRAT